MSWFAASIIGAGLGIAAKKPLINLAGKFFTGLNTVALKKLSSNFNLSMIPFAGIFQGLHTIGQNMALGRSVIETKIGLRAGWKQLRSGLRPDGAHVMRDVKSYMKATTAKSRMGIREGLRDRLGPDLYAKTKRTMGDLYLLDRAMESKKMFGPYLRSNLAVIALPTLASSMTAVKFMNWSYNKAAEKIRGYQDNSLGSF